MNIIKLLLLHNNKWNHLIVCKQMSSDSFKNIYNKMCLQIVDIKNICINSICD